MRRQFLEMIELRDPSVGPNDDPRSLQARQLILNTPVLLQRASLAFGEAERELAECSPRRAATRCSPPSPPPS